MAYTPKLLRVNLTAGTCKAETVPEKIAMDFIGARGIADKYLYDELSPGVDPLGPDNKLIFCIGPLAGTGAMSASRWMVVSKSPLTGTYYRGVGGADFGAWMRFAGLDMVIIEGKAAKPVYLYIEKGKYELKDAAELWGKGSFETHRKLEEIHGARTRVACIGPAGERLVLYASIPSGGRCVGRGGMGTVMGSKNLKAIAINAAPEAKLPRPEEFRELVHQEVIGMQAALLYRHFSEVGTSLMQDQTNMLGAFPTRNFREGTMRDFEKVSMASQQAMKEKDTACYACPIHCGNYCVVKEGKYAGAANDGPDYETTWVFTAPIDAPEMSHVIAADAYCDDMGIDTISAGGAIGFAYELFEKGILTAEDTGGLKLTYGDYEPAMELLKMIVERRGIGDLLAQGTKRAAAHIGKGTDYYAMQVKGLELPGYEPRGLKWHGFNLATSNAGGNHCYGYNGAEVFRLGAPHPVDRFADSGYASSTKFVQDFTAMIEVGIFCLFPGALGMISPRLFGQLLASATDVPTFAAPGYLFVTAEKIYNLERAFNLREGFGRKDDTLPQRLLTEPLKNAGPSEGQVIRNLGGMLDEYYLLRGWDMDGIPTAEKLKALGLEEVIKDIRK
jgi:aldehyde:ferredoxin oxidoreductase